MHFLLFDDARYLRFLPLTYTRPLSEIRCGILTMSEKWTHHLSLPIQYITQAHLQKKFPRITATWNICINSAIYPNKEILNAILSLKRNQSLIKDNVLIATHISQDMVEKFEIPYILLNTEQLHFTSTFDSLNNLWDIFSDNDREIRADFERLILGKEGEKVNKTNTVIGNQIFIEKGAKISCSIINTETGPVYIGKNAEIMEGSIIRGPFAMGENAVLKMGAKIYGATTLGPGCKVGGEVNNAVFFANSNKAHDGFVGNAIIGEWCNLGADTNNSNLKNNYEEVKIWSEMENKFIKTGLQFCGLIMADHSKCGINTMFNTGTVVGFSCNIYGAGFPRNFLPSFSWGSAAGMTEYQLSKAIETATKVFERRNLPFTDDDTEIFSHIFSVTQEQRNRYVK